RHASHRAARKAQRRAPRPFGRRFHIANRAALRSELRRFAFYPDRRHAARRLRGIFVARDPGHSKVAFASQRRNDSCGGRRRRYNPKMSILRTDSAKSQEVSGLIAGIAAFTTWGLIPIYWKLLGAVPATEILAHRFVWTTIFLSILLSWQRRWPELIANVRSPRARIYCLTGGLAIASNWFLFIYAVNIGRVIETALGYFMTPLMNVLFGALFLRERLTRLQFASVLLAALGVLNLSFGYGRFPWIAVFLCFPFGLYGLLRKQSGPAAIPGFSREWRRCRIVFGAIRK